MQLTYRGKVYYQQSLKTENFPQRAISGKYRGISFQINPGVSSSASFVPTPTAFQYRGISYVKNTLNIEH